MSDSNQAPVSHHNETLAALRARAEQRRHLVTQAVSDQTPHEVQRLVQELQMHQIELEMQYEELLLAQTEAEAARAQYVDLYELAPIGYLTLNSEGCIQQINLHAARLLGPVRQRLLRRRLALFVAPESRAPFADFLAALRATDHRQACELAFRRDDEHLFYGQLEGVRMVLPGGEVECRLALSDVTDRYKAQQALLESEARFRQLFEQSADAVLLVREKIIVDCNAAAVQMIGADSKTTLLGQPISLQVPEFQPNGASSAALTQQHYQAALRQGSHRFEWFRHTLQGEGLWQEIVLTRITLMGECLIHVVWRDITARYQAREQLRAEKEFSESLLASSVDGLVGLDRAGRVTAWNREAEHYSGIPAPQVLGQEIFAVLPHLDTPEARRVLAHVLQTGELVAQNNVPFGTRPGYYDAYLVPLRGEQPAAISGVLVVIRDMTERIRLVEETTRLKLSQQQEVLSAILTTEEAERKRIAEALHNGVGQLLYATKLHLTSQSSPRHPRDEVHSLLDEAIRMTRTISFELTPGILEDFGLQFALEELVRRIPRQSLVVQQHLVGLEQPLPKLLGVAVYRMVQELLNNIIKHAQAQEAVIHVVRENNKVAISVEDNGQGFEVDPRFAPHKGIGLPGLNNRIGLLGGTFLVNSRPGQGTIVSIELPVR